MPRIHLLSRNTLTLTLTLATPMYALAISPAFTSSFPLARHLIDEFIVR